MAINIIIIASFTKVLRLIKRSKKLCKHNYFPPSVHETISCSKHFAKALVYFTWNIYFSGIGLRNTAN